MIKAKKSLGQNFLIDKNILEVIVNTVKINNKSILEVGPGTGNLTSYILNKKPKDLFVVEKDRDLTKYLKEIYADQITIINKDILDIDEKSIFNEKITVFGNLPYNISTQILSKWIINLENDFWFDHLILMFQKEVADRIIAKYNTSSYGRLSILSNWKLNIKKVCDIKPGSFSPRPKIDSSLLIFSPKKYFYNIKSKNLEIITRTFFNQRRKMLKRPYNQVFKGNVNISKKLKINLNLRPQNLDFETYYQLTSEFENLNS